MNELLLWVDADRSVSSNLMHSYTVTKPSGAGCKIAVTLFANETTYDYDGRKGQQKGTRKRKITFL